MRWFWIDRFVEFESGRRAVAVKGTTLAEEQNDEYIPGFPVFPSSLMIEGLAQTGGLLVGEHSGFRARVVLAKVSKAVFPLPTLAGDMLTYTVVLQDVQPHGAICAGTIHCGDELRADVELVFAHLDDRFKGGELFEPAGFLRMLRLFRLYEVARDADGQPLAIPPHLLEAEAAEE